MSAIGGTVWPTPDVGRFVAIGDSFTEGVGDPHRHLPHNLRGWADRVADQLAKFEPGWEYANLAVRSKRLDQIVADQLEPALALRPSLISLYAGGNDLLDVGTDVSDLMQRYEHLVDRLACTGATLMLFTGYDVPVHPVLRVFERRNHQYNAEVRRIAAERGAVLIDAATWSQLADRRMWAPDRLHMSKRGHKLTAARVLETLGRPHSISAGPWDPEPAPTFAQIRREHHTWLREWVFPLVGRKIRRVTLGDGREPRWPEPVRVPSKGGLRRMVREGLPQR